MFPSFIGILDIQSWWEVPSIAYFCSLFRTAFNLLDFDIEELEEALLTDGTEDSASSLLTELIVRLLNGCLGNNDISAFNYQMYLRRLFRRKCQETGRENPFDNDIDFQFLPLRTKVEILYALCDFRLDAEDVFDLFKNLEAESLRVEPLGWDDNHSAYWYFYGTRLYREDIIKKEKPKGKDKKKKKGAESTTTTTNNRREWFAGDDWQDDGDTERVWQVVCFTEEDWAHLTQKFSEATSKEEKELYRSLSQNFLPEIPRLFQERERLQRKRLLELAPRRTSSRVLQKIKQKEEEEKHSASEEKVERRKDTPELAREIRARRRNLLRRKTPISSSSSSSESEKEEMPQKSSTSSKARVKKKSKSSAPKGEPPEVPVKSGRKTNNSLASVTGQIVIPDNDEQVSSTRKKLKTSQIFTMTEEDIQTDMYKVLEQLTNHEDAWPFMDPVEEEYAPNYYAVIRRPMDLRKMESRLDSGYYTDFSMFKTDFKLIVNNCRLYNGQDNEYTTMVDNLQAAFDRLTEKYMNRLSSSDEEIAVEYQLPTPSRKHKIKSSESPTRHKRKKRKSDSNGERKRSTSHTAKEEDEDEEPAATDTSKEKKSKTSHKTKTEKGKKKRKGHHRHGKHSKSHKTKDKQSKGKHGKKRHSKNKDGKKSKQKKKKSKHQEVKVEPELKRSESQESIESSYRSRSASPLPSIHTPTPSPEPPPASPEVKPDNDSDFYKDKFDKIKERRRQAASTSTAPDAWDSLFDPKSKAIDRYKQNLNLPKKDKNQKLRETIEKLKAKNEKYKDTFNALFKGKKKGKPSETSSSNNDDIDDPDFTDDDEEDDSQKSKPPRKTPKKHAAKNESTTQALEQAVKDISKWLEEAPKGSVASSPSNSPAQTISTEEHDNSRLDEEFPLTDKVPTKKETTRKRPSSREPKQVKRREIQRTIDRLQPGKSKGNLLTNSKNTEKTDEVALPGPLTKTRDTVKAEETVAQSPKLSLGSVLPTVEFTLGKDHNFDDEKKSSAPVETVKTSEPDKPEKKEEEKQDDKNKVDEKETVPKNTKKDAEVETEPTIISKPSQEKATPNLSAWFKAFGAPKTPAPAPAVKKKGEDNENDEKPNENIVNENNKLSSPKAATKYDSPTDPGTPNADGGDSPLLNVAATPRQRRTSTGSSVSERSSFSQDLDSPRHQMSHTSPLLRSPASPRTDDFQKISYPIINGTVRAGFYQDTTSMKSSPEKSCSPREMPQSPFSPYSQHVYASNNAMGSATPNYFVDHNKSPLPTYGQNPPPYYDTSKAGNANANKPRAHDEYTSLGPTTYPQTPYNGPYSPAESPYEQSQLSNYSPATQSPQPTIVESSPPVENAIITSDPKPSPYPVKKRSYIEPEAIITPRKSVESKEPVSVIQNQSETHRMNQQPLPTSSVDDIALALALNEKNDMTKLNNLQEKNTSEFVDREKSTFDNNVRHDPKKDAVNESKAHESVIKDNIDMVNMGYMNPDYDRRNHLQERIPVETHQSHEYPRDAHMNNQPKGYEVDAIAMNLGMTNQQLQKHMSKTNMNSGNIPPAHSNERLHCEMMSQNMTQAQHPYNALSSGQSVSNFSLNDIELANKKLFACNTTVSATPPIDYGNWKMSNQIRKQDTLPSDYSMPFSTSADKLRASINSTNASAINYNKSVQQQQYNNYNVPRASVHRTQDMQHNMSSELRIPNPRSHLKNDNNSTTSSMGDNQMMGKSMDNVSKSSKQDKHSHTQSHPLASPMSYKTPYSSHSSLPLDSLRIPQMLERYANDERYLSSFSGGGSSLYHDKSFEMAQMFNKSLAAEVHATSASASIYSQSSMTMSKDANIYKPPSSVASSSDSKAKAKRKRTTDTKQIPMSSGQSYHSSPTDMLSSVKSSMLPGSAFNFSSSANMSLGSGLYGDNGGFSIEDFRTSTANQLMAANYMAAAVAHQQRSSAAAEASANAEKLAKPAHQSSGHATGGFPFIGHGQPRGGYPFDASSPLYQQYLQRHQEELLRQTGAQIMGLYPAGYPSIRQPYDSINRPSWL